MLEKLTEGEHGNPETMYITEVKQERRDISTKHKAA